MPQPLFYLPRSILHSSLQSVWLLKKKFNCVLEFFWDCVCVCVCVIACACACVCLLVCMCVCRHLCVYVRFFGPMFISYCVYLVNLCISMFLFFSSAPFFFIFQFARRILDGISLTGISPTQEGAIIAADILENSTLQDQCSKCGYDIKSDDLVPCIGSKCGTLGRGKYFHKKCLPQEADYSKYLCEICDPKTRQDFCQKPLCKRPYNASCLECRHNCKRYIHRECIQGGLYIENWYCGVCQIAVK